MGIKHYNSYFSISNEIVVNVQIIDIGGIVKYKVTNNTYYEKADCFLLVFDITDKDSFIDCQNFYLEKIKENCKKKYKILLIGNKIDLEGERCVTSQKGSIFAFENNCKYMETSCFLNENVCEAFESVIDTTIIMNDDELKVDNYYDNYKKEENQKVIRPIDVNEQIVVFPKIMKFLNY